MALIWQDAARGAEAFWDSAAPIWLEWLSRYGPWIMLVLFVLLLVRALVNHGRFVALRVFDAAAQEEVHAALREAEKRTIGEIVPVVLERSDRHPNAKWLSALLTTLLGSLLLEGLLPWHNTLLLIACQFVLGLVGFGMALWLPAWKHMFISDKRAKQMAEEQAFQEFYKLALHETEARTGILIFVSLLEQRVVVLGDQGIDSKTDDEAWLETDDAILLGVMTKNLRAGLIEGIQRCADVLEKHFPWADGDRNEIPDRMVVRKE